VSDWSNEFLTEFVELYRGIERVCKVESKDYSDRVKKEQAYDVLVTKGANRDAVVK
jgi:hypothetical protein